MNIKKPGKPLWLVLWFGSCFTVLLYAVHSATLLAWREVGASVAVIGEPGEKGAVFTRHVGTTVVRIRSWHYVFHHDSNTPYLLYSRNLFETPWALYCLGAPIWQSPIGEPLESHWKPAIRREAVNGESRIFFRTIDGDTALIKDGSSGTR